MRNTLIICTLLLVLVVLVGCINFEIDDKDQDDEKPTPTPETTYVFDEVEYANEVSERRDYLNDFLLNYFRTHVDGYHVRDAFSVATAMFMEYEKTKDEEYLLETRSYIDIAWQRGKKGTDCFFVMCAVYHYLKCKDYYTLDKQAEYEEILINATGYGNKPSTRNHSLMAAVARYLMAERFPDADITAFYGDPGFDLNDPTGIKAINNRLLLYPIIGEYEYNSNGYFFWHYFPLRAIAELSLDEDLRNKADMVTENMIFTLAPVWLNGHLAVAQNRTYDQILSQTDHSAASILLWYFFGGPTPSYTQFLLNAGVNMGYLMASDFLPSKIAVCMANDRTKAYEHQELHYEYKSNSNTGYSNFLTTYMNEKYAVFSTKTSISPTSNYESRYLSAYKQVFKWGVKWVTEDTSEKSTLTIAQNNNINTDTNVKFGATPYQQLLQHKSTVIGVIDAPADLPFPELVISIPNNYVAIIDEAYTGKMYLHYGDIMIALYISEGFLYDSESIHQKTSPMTKGYFVVEVVEAANFSGSTPEEQLQYFQSTLDIKFRRIESDFSTNTKIKYISLDDTSMEIQYGGDLRSENGIINDEIQDYRKEVYPVQNNPWVTQGWMEKVITYTYNDEKITFNFEDWTKTYD